MWQSSKADVLAHEKAQATAMTVAVLTNYRVSWYRYAVVTYICDYWAKDETGTRTHTETNTQFMFPSITICPTEYNSANVKLISLHSNFTFEDFQSLPSIKDNAVISVMALKSYYPE